MRWVAILALVGACGRVGYDAEAIETIGLVDGGPVADSDFLSPDATTGAAIDAAVVDAGLQEIDAAVIDAAVIDAAVIDAAVIDPAVIDAAVIDAAVIDAAAIDAAAIDAALQEVDAATLLVVNGSYSAAPVVYTCAIGLVDVNFNSLVFSDNSSNLTVTTNDVGTPVQPCAMIGSSAEGTGNINVTCTLAGGCDEIYTLTGTFTGPDTWSGTFTADFVGSCLNCANQAIPVTGTRQ